MSKTILLIGTLDTKGDEFAFVRDLIEKRGHQTVLMDAGVFPASVPADISAEEVARAGGMELDALRTRADRGQAMAVMQRGVATLTRSLFERGEIDGVLGLGGSGGTVLATAGMRSLPVGVPKVMVSTLASGDVAAYVDTKDITMMYSVIDIAGLNRLSRRVLGNAAGMICGALEQEMPAGDDRPLIAASMFGVTTPCVTEVRRRLEQAGYEVVVFHATGSGGRAMEGLIADGFFVGVADLTTTEWCDELVGGVLSAGPDRLDAAARAGLPQVVSVGALDMVNFWGLDTVPVQFRDRNLYQHNENVTLMRTTVEESRELGRIVAEKLSAARGPVVVMLPLKGVSMIDAPGEQFYSPEADQALFGAFREHLADHVQLIEVDAHINDDTFAGAVAEELLKLLGNTP
ncbi:MAG: Tm-1-like ATP-binding domain-containing protein [Trueperaceae bacterium]|nr:MAG: Tm-1-like ATP-binding domain-containing protein [Trueperaceae bacterium]